MKAAVIVFPGSNCDRDAAVALQRVTGLAPDMVWHRETELPAVDLIVVPGGFSYGDYLRCGAIGALSPIMRAVKQRAEQGVAVLGICNGFQILAETGLLPGALMRNAALKFVSRPVALRVENPDSPFTLRYRKDQLVSFPAAHHDGNYFADPAVLARLEGEGLVAFRYAADAANAEGPPDNPNGSINDIAGIFNPGRTVLGLMPHPERAADPALGNTDGLAMFEGLVEALA
jgi:phosphoribosylformylglycinamidine synthase